MIKRGENMILTNDMLKSSFSEYSNKNTKLARYLRDGNIFKIRNGLYETDASTPGYLLAGSIYGPSYISFEYALAAYGLIPERVNTITCATFNKKKKKEYNNHFGIFTYRDIPASAYPLEILLKIEGDYSYQIATPEKALCDKLYTLKPMHNFTNVQTMLFDDLRIDREEFKKIDSNKIERLANLYHSMNVKLLAKYLRRIKDE